jgi:SAM-dependent methyltransferase
MVAFSFFFFFFFFFFFVLPSGVLSFAAAGGGSRHTLVLTESDRRKWDPMPDSRFYAQPRLVNHVDQGFLSRLTELYAKLIPEGGDVLDMMSSWVSHLPEDCSYNSVVGLGMNEDELRKNPRLTTHMVADLNARPSLAFFDDESFDAVLCAVSVQYLVFPERVFADVHRVLKPDGVAVFSFSNRMFGEKAINAWLQRDDAGRITLVRSYFDCVCAGFTTPQIVSEEGLAGSWLNSAARNILGINLSDPFFAVYARKQ